MTQLMNARKNAVRRKFKQYMDDSKYRRAYRNRIYYNVNQDVPADDSKNMPIRLTYSPEQPVQNATTPLRKSPSLRTRPHRTPQPTRIPRAVELMQQQMPKMNAKASTPRTDSFDAADWKKLGMKVSNFERFFFYYYR